jgi:hypothetical protein
VTSPPVPPPPVAPNPYPPLADPNDPDWASFQAQDPDYFLKVAGARIRTYCGWRIYPNGTDTKDKLRVRTNGRILLPTLYLTDVASVTIQTGVDMEVTLDPDMYEWFPTGYIQPIGLGTGWWWGSYSGYYYGPDTPAYLPWLNFGYATVTFSHGYPAVPDDVKAVAYELAEVAAEMSAGNVSGISTPGYQLTLTRNAGLNLNAEQMDRLAPYRLPVVA